MRSNGEQFSFGAEQTGVSEVLLEDIRKSQLEVKRDKDKLAESFEIATAQVIAYLESLKQEMTSQEKDQWYISLFKDHSVRHKELASLYEVTNSENGVLERALMQLVMAAIQRSGDKKNDEYLAEW